MDGNEALVFTDYKSERTPESLDQKGYGGC